MHKLKYYIKLAAATFCFIAAVVAYQSYQNRERIVPFSEYQDKGVYTFYPKSIQPRRETRKEVKVDNYRTKWHTYYYLQYKDNAKHKYEVKYVSKQDAEEVLAENQAIERKVIALKSKQAYLTTEPDEDVLSFAIKRNGLFYLQLYGSLAYIIIYGLVMFMLWQKAQKKKQQALQKTSTDDKPPYFK